MPTVFKWDNTGWVIWNSREHSHLISPLHKVHRSLTYAHMCSSLLWWVVGGDKENVRHGFTPCSKIVKLQSLCDPYRCIAVSKCILLRSIRHRPTGSLNNGLARTTNQYIPPGLNRLRPLRLFPPCHTGYSQEKCLFLHTAGVGENAIGSPFQRQHIDITNWFDQLDMFSPGNVIAFQAGPRARMASHNAVDLFRNCSIKASQPCLDMRNGNMELRCCQCASKCGVCITIHDHPIRALFHKNLLNSLEHTTGLCSM